ncbi:MAG: hypothetical protein KGI19_06815 [Thaumarchaeota archaeon]|nr:hypothetical protein [Nitrososphaerota archaeon]
MTSQKQKKEPTEEEMKKILKELDVMVVIPMHEEKNYAQESITASKIGSLDTIEYYRIQCGGTLNYGLAVVGKGNMVTSQVTEKIIHQCQGIKLITLLGIGGSIDPTIKVCDVILGTEVIYYMDSSRIKDGESTLQISCKHWLLDQEMVNFVQNLKNLEMSMYVKLQNKFPEQLEFMRSHSTICNEKPTIKSGKIASGESVIESTSFASKLRDSDRCLRVVECEAAGVCQAAFGRELKVRMMVLRGIADLANPDKDLLEKRVRKYAMNSVCMTLKLLLGNKEFEKIVLGKAKERKPSSWFKLKGFLSWKVKSRKLYRITKWVEKNSHKLALLVGILGIVLSYLIR